MEWVVRFFLLSFFLSKQKELGASATAKHCKRHRNEFTITIWLYRVADIVVIRKPYFVVIPNLFYRGFNMKYCYRSYWSSVKISPEPFKEFYSMKIGVVKIQRFISREEGGIRFLSWGSILYGKLKRKQDFTKGLKKVQPFQENRILFHVHFWVTISFVFFEWTPFNNG